MAAIFRDLPGQRMQDVHARRPLVQPVGGPAGAMGCLVVPDPGGLNDSLVAGAQVATLAQELARPAHVGPVADESARNRMRGLVTAVTKDKSLSAQFEHSVGVTEKGCEIFTLSPAGYTVPPYR